MPGEHVEVDDKAFVAAVPAEMEAYKVAAREFIEKTAEKVVQVAEQLAPVRTGRLKEDIDAHPFVREANGGYVQITVKVREGFYQEFGTSVMRAHPFLRPAMAEAAGGLRSVGVAARLSAGAQARANIKRAAARQRVRNAFKKGVISSQERRKLARAIAHTNRRNNALLARQRAARRARRRPRGG